MNNNNTTKKLLIDVTKRLLSADESIDNLTARQISAEAGINLAMINYCFKSKEELLKLAIDEIIAEEFKEYAVNQNEEMTSKEQLRHLLYHVCDITMKYSRLTKLSIPYILLNDDITLPYDVLPFITKHYQGSKSESECKVIAFQLIYTLQLIFYRSDDFHKYSGIDITHMEELYRLIDLQLNLLF
jgi:AcrR family transcriptional regulator